MKKRWIAFLAAFVLLCTAFSAAAEESGRKAELFDLFNYGGESMEWSGVAIPLTDGLLVTSAANLPEDIQYLAITDGTSVWEPMSVLKDQSGMLAFIFYDAEEKKPERTGYSFCNPVTTLRADDLYARSGDASASRLNRSVLALDKTTWQGIPCLLVTLSGPVEPGTPLLTEDDKLAGVIIASRAEGINRYVAITVEAVYARLLEAVDDPTADLLHLRGPEGFSVSVDRNLVTFDWSGMTIPEEEGKKAYLVVSDIQNSYLVYYSVAEIEKKQVQMVLCPGRTYLSGIVLSAGAPDRTPTEAVVTALPEAEKLTAYDFRTLVCAFAEAPEEGLKDGEAPVILQEITEEQLRSGRLYYYSSSSYRVTEKLEDCTLLVALEVPGGETYLYASGWYYDPDLNADDTWYQPLKDTGLLDELNRKGYPSGEYRVSMYVDGLLAGEFTFTLP